MSKLYSYVSDIFTFIHSLIEFLNSILTTRQFLFKGVSKNCFLQVLSVIRCNGTEVVSSEKDKIKVANDLKLFLEEQTLTDAVLEVKGGHKYPVSSTAHSTQIHYKLKIVRINEVTIAISAQPIRMQVSFELRKLVKCKKGPEALTWPLKTIFFVYSSAFLHS